VEPLHQVEILRIRHVDRPKQQCIQNAEHDGVHADPKRERHDRRQGESRRFGQCAPCEAQVGGQVLEQMP